MKKLDCYDDLVGCYVDDEKIISVDCFKYMNNDGKDKISVKLHLSDDTSCFLDNSTVSFAKTPFDAIQRKKDSDNI